MLLPGIILLARVFIMILILLLAPYWMGGLQVCGHMCVIKAIRSHRHFDSGPVQQIVRADQTYQALCVHSGNTESLLLTARGTIKALC